MKCHRCLPTSRCSLNYKNFILCITYNCILLFLNRPDNVFKLYVAVASKFLFQNLIINLYIALKSIDHLPSTDLVLPFRLDFPAHPTCRSLVRRLSFVKVIEQSTYRRSPIINQRNPASLLGKIPDSDVENFRFIISIVAKIYSSEKRRIEHLLIT